MNNTQVKKIDRISEELTELGATGENYFDRSKFDRLVRELESIYASASDRTKDQADAKGYLDAAICCLHEIHGNSVEEMNQHLEFIDYLNRATLVSQDFCGM